MWQTTMNPRAPVALYLSALLGLSWPGAWAGKPSITPSAVINISFDPADRKVVFEQSGFVKIPEGVSFYIREVLGGPSFGNHQENFDLGSLGPPTLTRYEIPPSRVVTNGDCQVAGHVAPVLILEDPIPNLYVTNSTSDLELFLPGAYESGDSLVGSATSSEDAANRQYSSLADAGFVEGESCYVEYDADNDGEIDENDTAIEWIVSVTPSASPSISSSPTASRSPTASPTVRDTNDSEPEGGLSEGLLFGLVAAGCILLLCISLLLYVFARKRNSRKDESEVQRTSVDSGNANDVRAAVSSGSASDENQPPEGQQEETPDVEAAPSVLGAQENQQGGPVERGPDAPGKRLETIKEASSTCEVNASRVALEEQQKKDSDDQEKEDVPEQEIEEIEEEDQNSKPNTSDESAKESTFAAPPSKEWLENELHEDEEASTEKENHDEMIDSEEEHASDTGDIKDDELSEAVES